MTAEVFCNDKSYLCTTMTGIEIEDIGKSDDLLLITIITNHKSHLLIYGKVAMLVGNIIAQGIM